MEHRWGYRFSLNMPVRLLAESRRPLLGRLQNASVSGAYVQATGRLPLWVQLQVELVLPGRPSQQTECVSAHVTRRTKDGVGLEWCDLAPGPVRQLLATLPQLSAPVHRIAAREGGQLAIEAQVEAQSSP